MRRVVAVAVLAGWAWAPRASAQETYGLPLHGEEAETFLRTAEVVKKKSLGTGITGSQRYTLSDGSRTAQAVWKTIDEYKHGLTRLERGGVIMDFADSYKFEIAAYELDKLLGLDLVPPTVERTFGRTTGSLQLWVEKAMTEADRQQKKLKPTNPVTWNEQMYKVRLLHQLTYNTDYKNIRNVLFDESFRVYAIDFSRAFAPYPDLLDESDLLRFSRSALERLKALDRDTLEAKIGRYVSGNRLSTLLTRRDKIVALAEKRIAGSGEAAVLYP